MNLVLVHYGEKISVITGEGPGPGHSQGETQNSSPIPSGQTRQETQDMGEGTKKKHGPRCGVFTSFTLSDAHIICSVL